MTDRDRIAEVSAGGVVFKKEDGKILFCIVNTHDGQDWQFPKGHLEAGESLEEAALREVREESGLRAKCLEKIAETNYTFERGSLIVEKSVHFYLMEFLDGNLADHDHEVREARWVLESDVLAALTYENEKDVARRALAMIQGRT